MSENIKNLEHIINNHATSDELRKQTDRFNEASKTNQLNPDIKFEYAVTLTRSSLRADYHRAMNLLEDLCVSGNPDAFRDYLFYLIIVNIKLEVNRID